MTFQVFTRRLFRAVHSPMRAKDTLVEMIGRESVSLALWYGTGKM